MTGSGKELVPVSRGRGRPSLYTEEVVEEILDRMIHGEPLIQICRQTRDGFTRLKGEFPNHATVYDWGDPANPQHRPQFSARFARAKLAQQRFWLEEIVIISNEPEMGVEEMIELGPKGKTLRRMRKDMLQHRALKIDARLKAIERMNPQHWAQRLQQLEPGAESQQSQKLIIEGGLPDDTTPPPPPPHMEEPGG